jgi:HAD superfamily hydrolase (TIGR01484 family)
MTGGAAKDGAEIRLVALDMDGTSLERGRTFQPALVSALKALAQRGVRYATATGRPFGFQLDILPANGLGAAAGTPHAIMADEREIFLLRGGRYVTHAAWNDEIRSRWERLHAPAMEWLRAAEREGTSRGWHCFQHEEEARMKARGLPTLAFDDAEKAHAIREWLAGKLAESGDALVANRNNRLVQLHDAAAGKGNVLLELARMWELRPEQVLAVGDSANDFSMLDGRHRFKAGAPGNADQGVQHAVQTAGGYVAAERVGLGVVEILRHYALV